MPGSRSEGLMFYLPQPFPLLSVLLTCSWLVSSALYSTGLFFSLIPYGLCESIMSHPVPSYPI